MITCQSLISRRYVSVKAADGSPLCTTEQPSKVVAMSADPVSYRCGKECTQCTTCTVCWRVQWAIDVPKSVLSVQLVSSIRRTRLRNSANSSTTRLRTTPKSTSAKLTMVSSAKTFLQMFWGYFYRHFPKARNTVSDFFLKMFGWSFPITSRWIFQDGIPENVSREKEDDWKKLCKS